MTTPDKNSIRDRLRSPAPLGEQSGGGDTRHSGVSGADFQQTDSAAATGDERQRSHAMDAPQVEAEATPEELAAAEKRAERLVVGLFLLSALSVLGFFVSYWAVPFEFELENGAWKYYTPLLGLFMGLALFGIGAGAVVWAKRLMHDVETVQERHDFASSPELRAEVGEMLVRGFEETQLPRRKMIGASLALGGGALALLPLPLILDLGPWRHKERALRTTGWKKGVRLIRQDGTPVKMGDLVVGAVESVFPDVPRGTRLADSPALLIRMRPEELRPRQGREDWVVDGHVVYSSICTHLGCPVKLYEQITHNLFCPCHQSTFDASNGCKVVFGPAARPLPQLPIAVDEDGYFVAQSDFTEPVGPSFWERA